MSQNLRKPMYRIAQKFVVFKVHVFLSNRKKSYKTEILKLLNLC